MKINTKRKETYKLFKWVIFERDTQEVTTQIDELIDPVINLERNIKDLKFN